VGQTRSPITSQTGRLNWAESIVLLNGFRMYWKNCSHIGWFSSARSFTSCSAGTFRPRLYNPIGSPGSSRNRKKFATTTNATVPTAASSRRRR
jgi:hypothetical protein